MSRLFLQIPTISGVVISATFENFLSLEEKSDDLIRRTNMKEKNITVNSPNFFEWLALLFIGLRLARVIAWPWVWVLTPLWLPVCLVIIIAAQKFI